MTSDARVRIVDAISELMSSLLDDWDLASVDWSEIEGLLAEMEWQSRDDENMARLRELVLISRGLFEPALTAEIKFTLALHAAVNHAREHYGDQDEPTRDETDKPESEATTDATERQEAAQEAMEGDDEMEDAAHHRDAIVEVFRNSDESNKPEPEATADAAEPQEAEEDAKPEDVKFFREAADRELDIYRMARTMTPEEMDAFARSLLEQHMRVKAANAIATQVQFVSRRMTKAVDDAFDTYKEESEDIYESGTHGPTQLLMVP